MFNVKRKIFLMLAVSLAIGITVTAAQADDDHGREGHGGEGHVKTTLKAPANSLWQKECAACHIAYAPGLLNAESWRKVMAGLDKHFNSDASLPAREAAEISAFLQNNASGKTGAATLRISETAWFKRQHDGHEISPEVWKRAAVKSPANCAACHPQAERGNFNEHEIRIPR